MKRTSSAIVPSKTAKVPSGSKPARATDPAVPVKTVVLFSSGVGYFEHFGEVTGNAQNTLHFKTDQINDILKSLVLEDLSGGKVTSVVYPSLDPLTRILKSFAIDIASDPSLAELLKQLRGVKITVSFQAENLSGTILGLEQKPKAVGQTSIEVWALNILAGGTIRSVELADVQRIQLEDAQLQDELNKALAALSQARDQDKKPVTIQFVGEGERHVRIGYVVQTPVWKTSYRLLLPPTPKDKSRLQGWAIVENQTDSDWNSVQLSLVSGRPISFIQELYQPLYIHRPTVRPELFAGLGPQTYDAGLRLQAVMPLLAHLNRRSTSGADRAANEERESCAAMLPEAGSPPSSDMLERSADFGSSIASVASAQKIGELFQYTVDDVSLPRQRSAMIPIVTDSIEVEKLSIYNQSVLSSNPLIGGRVKNTTGKHLLSGPITVLEGSSYAGDCRIDDLPPGQERLISYGVDLQVLVNATAQTNESRIQSGKIAGGLLQVSSKEVFTQTYTMENKADDDRVIIVEHPVRQDWTLVDTAKPVETTEAVYRFQLRVLAKKSGKLTVRQENRSWQTIAVLSCDIRQLHLFSEEKEIDAKVRSAIKKAVGFREAMKETQRQMERKDFERVTITKDQDRIRENMKAVAQTSEYYNRLLSKLNEQETSIEKLHSEAEALRVRHDEQQKSLQDYLAQLAIE